MGGRGITQLLLKWSEGDEAALDQLTPLVYDELRRLARSYLRDDAPATFRVIVDPRSAPIVEGSTLDFDAAMIGGGLKVKNPRAVHECACGDSFAI